MLDICLSSASRWSSESETSRPLRVPETMSVLASLNWASRSLSSPTAVAISRIHLGAERLDRLRAVVQRAHDLARRVDGVLGKVAVGRRGRIELQRLLQSADRGRRRRGVVDAVDGKAEPLHAVVERALPFQRRQRAEIVLEQQFVGRALDIDRARAGRGAGDHRDPPGVIGVGCIRNVAGDDAGLPRRVAERRLGDAQGGGQRHVLSFLGCRQRDYLFRLTRMSIRSAPVWNTLEFAV